MKTSEAVRMLSALAQEHRLALFRLLVRRGPQGLAAGDIAERLGLPAPTLSFHLRAVEQAGLISARRSGRFLYYSANFDHMDALIGFLTENCCGGPDAASRRICADAASAASPARVRRRA